MDEKEKKNPTLLIGIGGTGGNVVNLIKQEIDKKEKARFGAIDLDEKQEEEEK